MLGFLSSLWVMSRMSSMAGGATKHIEPSCASAFRLTSGKMSPTTAQQRVWIFQLNLQPTRGKSQDTVEKVRSSVHCFAHKTEQLFGKCSTRLFTRGSRHHCSKCGWENGVQIGWASCNWLMAQAYLNHIWRLHLKFQQFILISDALQFSGGCLTLGNHLKRHGTQIHDPHSRIMCTTFEHSMQFTSWTRNKHTNWYLLHNNIVALHCGSLESSNLLAQCFYLLPTNCMKPFCAHTANICVHGQGEDCLGNSWTPLDHYIPLPLPLPLA